MNLIYEGVNITEQVEISKALFTDNASGVADNVGIVFTDNEKLWRDWAPQKGEKIILKENGLSTGLMYIDEPEASGGKFILKAISTPLEAKTPRTNSWENIQFKSFASDLVEQIGLSLATYGITNHLYDRIDQVEQTNLQFLNERCQLEGYCLKIVDGKAVIYDERQMEREKPVLTLTEDLFIGEYRFKSISSGLYSACEIAYLDNRNSLIQYKFSPSGAPKGPVLRPKVRAVSHGEAQRFSSGLLRLANKYETTGIVTVQLNTSISAGNVVEVSNLAFFSGRYFLYRVTHDLTGGRTQISMRMVLEEY